ncbi:ATP-binding protein [Frigidibacter sp. RF13]|uniref:ATP-binding protein n=1 Tax=Frigidibacter sp. RF13 TaxID=2997340 RepID=UPI00226DB7B3|nr:ATP-binding protein [Frigidibacter sp. RF13]MCY1128596.1 ATP-binding protein [Frigidibacter sp. RF13]
MFDWLKQFLPKGLYGRAALILILPILTIQLVVSVLFVQRYFTDVTQQMSRNIMPELRMIETELRGAASAEAGFAAAASRASGLGLVLTRQDEVQTEDGRVFYDFSGRVVIRTLREAFESLKGVDLSDLRTVRLSFDSPHGPYQLQFSRNRVTARNPHQLLVYMLATGALMTLVAFVFLRNQLRPIRRLAVAAEAFGKGRTVPYRIAGASEVRAAGAAFLDMRARIERQMEQRTQMLSGVSHDLRTPLTRLKLGLAMLGDGEEVQALERDVEDMRRMLDGFLAFARTDALEGDAEEVDPAELARRAVDDAHRMGRHVIFQGAVGEGVALWRAGAVRRALDNLISNAVTYGGMAEVSVAILEKSVRFTIEDDGPGIPEDKREEALKPFVRLVPGRNQDQGSGVGLGLAITADIARSHGGSLRLGESERLGGLKAELILAR